MVASIKRLPRARILGAIVAAFLFGAVVKIAIADDYHYNTGILHGWVRGCCINDGSFFSRTENDGNHIPISCMLNTVNGYGTPWRTIEYPGTTCNMHSRDYWQSATECKYRAWNSAFTAFDAHPHWPSYYCG